MKPVLVLALILGVAAAARAEPVVPVRVNGPQTNRIGLAILGDGYAAGDQIKYATDVDLLVKALFEQQPYATYADYFNVYRVDVVSNESGADHPERGVARDTALGATYNCGNIQRLICVNSGAVNAVLLRSLPPDARQVVVVLVNDAEYGGSGGAFTIASTHTDVVELVLHEGGHSFGLLADEYTLQPPGCFNSIEPAEANAAKAIGRDEIKWSRWIAAETPLPTGGSTPGVPGAFEGARYCPTGLYRPTFDSKMRSLGRPFEQVNSEQLIRRIYNFVSPIDTISPGSALVAPPRGALVDFAVTTPSPASHTLSVRWFVDGLEVGQGSGLRLNTALMGAGLHTVEVDVSDPTPAVRHDPDGVLRERRGWMLTVEQPTPEDLKAAFDELIRRWRGPR